MSHYTTGKVETAQHPALILGEITTAALAQQVLGRGNARSARDWCQRHGVPYRRDGKLNWVLLADVRRVLEGLPLHHALTRRVEAKAAAAVLTAGDWRSVGMP